MSEPGGTAVRVRDLLDRASTHLDALSGDLSRGRGPDPAAVAADWPQFQRAARYALQPLHRTSMRGAIPTAVRATLKALPADTADAAWSQTGQSERARSDLGRAAHALAAAGDLVRFVVPAVPEDPLLANPGATVTDRAAGWELRQRDLNVTAVAVAALVASAAQITVHATVHDLRHLPVAVEAVSVAAAAAQVLHADPHQGSRGRLDEVATSARPAVQAGSLTSLLRAACHDWRRAALAAAGGTDVSHHDLRTTATGAGQLMTVSTLALRSHLYQLSHNGPDGESGQGSTTKWQREMMRETDLEARATISSWNTAADVWNAHVTAAPASAALLHANVELNQIISALAQKRGQWLDPSVLSAGAHQRELLDVAAEAVAAVHDVARAHRSAVDRLLQQGHVYAPARRLPAIGDDNALLWKRPQAEQDRIIAERLQAVSRGGWVRLELATETAPVREAYRDLSALTHQVRMRFVTTTQQSQARAPWRDLVESIAERGSRTSPTPAPTTASSSERPARPVRRDDRRSVSPGAPHSTTGLRPR